MNAIDAYADAVKRSLEAVYEGQREPLEAAALWLSDTLQRDGLLYVAGSGHSHMLVEEAFYRAGGIAAVYPLLEPSLMLHAGALKGTRLERVEGIAAALLADTEMGPEDLLIAASNSGRNAFAIEAVLEARERGCRTIAITSRTHSQQVGSRHSSGKSLFEIADLVIDNAAPLGDASLSIAGLGARVGPVSSITGIYIINALVARAVELQVAKGAPPDVFVSANVESGHTLDLRHWQRRVRGL